MPEFIQAADEGAISVQRQMKCEKKDGFLNREWTRIAALTSHGFVSNDCLILLCVTTPGSWERWRAASCETARECVVQSEVSKVK